MTIGELLKEYRISQGKRQKEFTNNGEIISQSFYSKVEKAANKITVDNLIEILHYNNISLWEFFSRLNQNDDMRHQQMEELHNMMISAYYDRNDRELLNIKSLIAESNMSDKDKREQELIVDGWIESIKTNPKSYDKNLREELKDKIFDSPNMDKNTITLYCNFMTFYDLENNKFIATKILDQHKNTHNVDIQIALLAIIGNILAISIEKDNVDNLEFFIQTAEHIPTRPETFFYKNGLFLFKNLIKYKKEKESIYLDNCWQAIETYINLNMKIYGNKLKKFVIRQINKYESYLKIKFKYDFSV